MAYGTIKVDQVTFTNGGVDQTISVSGIVQSISGDITATGTIQGATIIGTSTVSGATVTGDAGQFITATAATGVFTSTLSGATITGNTASFTTITGGTITLTSGVFASGTAAAPSVSVGTTDNGLYSPGTDQVAISTNGTGRLFVDANGRVGVGISAPNAPLAVASEGGLNLALVGRNNNPADEAQLYFMRNNGSTLQALIAVNNDNLSFHTGSSGTERLRITSAGLVGIGTSSPGNLLHVESSFTGTLVKIKNNAGSTSADTALEIESSTTAAKTLLVKNAGTERFYVQGNGTSYFNGSLGIGTTSPTTPLSVRTVSSIPTYGNVSANFSDNTTGTLYISHSSGVQGLISDGTLAFGTGVSGTERARIDSSGRLLVGTSSNFDADAILQTQGEGIAIKRNTNLTGVNNGLIRFYSGAGLTAQIFGLNDGAQASGDTPGALVFSTTADGSASPTERLRITSAGLIGIGTSDPTSGTSSYYDDLVVRNATSGTGAGITIQSNSTNGFSGLNLRKADGTDAAKFVSESSSGKLYIETAGLAAITADSSQRVGIGTTSPSQTLHVSAATGTRIQVSHTGGSVNALLGTDSGNAFIGTSTNHDFRFITNNGEKARIDSSGRLLVGTSSAVGTSSGTGLIVRSPVNNNHAGEILLQNAYTRPGDGSAVGSIKFQDSEGSTYAQITGNQDGTASSSSDVPGRLVFSTTADSASSPTERMRIDSSGRVGIGTTSPSHALDIVGNLAVSQGSRLYLTNNSGFSTNITNTADADSMQFHQANTERMRIDSSGRLLVGTSTALSTNTGALLQLYGTGGSEFIGSSANNNPAADAPITMIRGLSQSGSSFGTCATIAIQSDGTTSLNDYPGRIVFSTTADSASSPTERMRINNVGAVNYYNASSDSIAARSGVSAGTGQYLYLGYNSATSTSNGTYCYGVYTNGDVVNTNNSYGAISDAKLKENIVDASSQWADLKALQVRNYNFKEGQTHTQIGLIAQEVELVSPGLVSESPDRDEDGNELGTTTKSVNYSVLYMKAVKALQEAMERIETLEAKVAALESA